MTGHPANTSFQVSGTYFEACNCDPICPCRSVGGRPGGRSSYGECFGTLSWRITSGRAGDLDLSNLSVVLSLRYFDDDPGSPWTVILYLDRDANEAQRDALASIFLGRWGGTPLRNFAAAIGTVAAVRSGRISLAHASGHEQIVVDEVVHVRAARPVDSPEQVACGIPGYDHPGQEVHAELLHSADGPMTWEVRERCGFSTDFAYSSDR